jgi:parallel beta-helix repeat protein
MGTRKVFSTFFLLPILFMSLNIMATTYYVKTDGNDLASGTSWAAAFKTIQKGINTSANKDIVEVNEGTYYGTVNITNKGITLTSVNPENWDVVANTIIDANFVNTAVNISGGSIQPVLTGFTIRNAAQYGIYISNLAKVTKCIIKNNGYYGISLSSGWDVTISNNIIYGHDYGIVLSYVLDAISINNNLIYENYTGISFVDIYATVNFINNTVVKCNYGVLSNDGENPDFKICNCIIWGNADDLNGASATYSCIQDPNDAFGTGNTSSDPCFVDADANDFHLMAGSSCIDRGDSNLIDVNEIDIDGDTRIIDGDIDEIDRVDMGSDEFNPVSWAEPNVIYVDEDAVGDNDGTTWANAFTKLQDGLAAASYGKQIWVAEGNYYPDEGVGHIDANIYDSFNMVEGVDIYGGFAGNETSLDMRDWIINETILRGDIDKDDGNGLTEYDNQNSRHILYCIYDVNISGFTIANSYGHKDTSTSLEGGGLCINNSSPIITNCIFKKNFRSAIYSTNGHPSIINCEFIYNGYSVTDYQGMPTSGGAIQLQICKGSILKNCKFVNNSAQNRGGALYFFDSNETKIINCEFIGNHTAVTGYGYGGAIYLSRSDIEITNCIFAGNFAKGLLSYYGAGVLYNVDSSPLLTNNILWENDCKSNSAYKSIRFSNSRHPGDCPIIRNCDISDSNGSDPNWSPYLGVDDGNNIDRDPNFVHIFKFNVIAEMVGLYRNQIIVPDTNRFQIGDVIEYNNDGVARTITDVNITTKVITFNEPLDLNYLNTRPGRCVYNWGPNVTDMNENLHFIDGASPCVDTGDNSSIEELKDLDENTRKIDGNYDQIITVDMGCYEYDPNS